MSQQRFSLLELICRCFRYRPRKSSSYQLIPLPQDIPEQSSECQGKKTLLIDLDETLVHSSFEPIQHCSFVLDLNINGQPYKIYVSERPGAKEFLEEMAKHYEIFIFTASISEYASPVIDRLDPKRVVAMRLYRENCTNYRGILVKDLSQMKREMSDMILIDNSCNSFVFQPLNAIHILSYTQDQNDQELTLLIPFLRLLAQFKDVRPVHEWLFKYAHMERFKFVNKRGQEQQYQAEGLSGQETGRESQPLDTPKVEELHGLVVLKSARKGEEEEQEGKGSPEHETAEKSCKTENEELRNQLNINSPHSHSPGKLVHFPL